MGALNHSTIGKVLLGGFSLNIILGMSNSLNNASMYIASYMTFMRSLSGGELVSLSDVSWVYTLNVALVGVTLPFGGYINRRLGVRTSLYITTTILSISTFSAYYLVSSYYLFIATLGCLTGIAAGISFNIPQYCAYKFWPENKGTASSIVVSGLALSPVIFSPIQTMIVNPRNLSPSLKIGNSLYFGQEEVASKVPVIFIAMGILVLLLSVISLLTLLEPERERESTPADRAKESSENGENASGIEFESGDLLAKEVPSGKIETRTKGTLLNQTTDEQVAVDKAGFKRITLSSCAPLFGFGGELGSVSREEHDSSDALEVEVQGIMSSTISGKESCYAKPFIDLETCSENGCYSILPSPLFSSDCDRKVLKSQRDGRSDPTGTTSVVIAFPNRLEENSALLDSGGDGESVESSGTRRGFAECLEGTQHKNGNLTEIFILVKLLRERRFWLIFWLLFFFTQYAHFINSWWKSIGIIKLNIPDDTLATFGTIITSLCNVSGRFFLGSLLDKYKGRFCLISISLSCSVSMLLFQYVINFGSQPIYLFTVCLMFFNSGAGFVLFPPIVAENFGVKYYTFIYGVAYIGRSFGVLVNSLLTSLVINSISIEFCSVVFFILTWILCSLSFKFKNEFEFSDPNLEKELFF